MKTEIVVDNLTLEEVERYEMAIKLKKEAERVYDVFKRKCTLTPAMYRNGKFKVWDDGNNRAFISIDENGEFLFQARFLHESYDITVTVNGIYEALKRERGGVGHLEHCKYEIR